MAGSDFGGDGRGDENLPQIDAGISAGTEAGEGIGLVIGVHPAIGVDRDAPGNGIGERADIAEFGQHEGI